VITAHEQTFKEMMMSQEHIKRSLLTAVPEAQDHQPLLVLFLMFFVTMVAATAGIITLGEDLGILSLSIIGLIIVIIGILLLKNYLRARRLDQFGELTEGMIVEMWVDEETPYQSDEHYIAYEFGDNLRVTQKINAQTFQILCLGQSVTIRYLPDNPRFSRMELG
jgi:hypothetical protein